MSRPATTSRLSEEKSASASKHWAGRRLEKEVHLLANAQQAAFGFQREIEIVVFRPANRAQQNRVRRLRLGQSLIRQRHTMGVIGRAADQVFADIELKPALGAEPVDDLADLGHDFGADPVAGQDEDGRIFHVGAP